MKLIEYYSDMVGSFSPPESQWKQPEVKKSSVEGLCNLHSDGTYVGIEIEVENVPHVVSEGDAGLNDLHLLLHKTHLLKHNREAMELAVFLELWDVKHDHSLRGDQAREFNFHVPYKGKALQLAIHSLDTVFSSGYNDLTLFSPRGATHVHINMLDQHMKAFAFSLLVYCFLEQLLFNYCEENRRESIYSVSLCHSSHTRSLVSDFVSSIDLCSRMQAETTATKLKAAAFQILVTSWPKYSAINVGEDKGAKGTIEYRHLETTFSSEKLFQWVNILLDIKNYSASLHNEGISFSQFCDSLIQNPMGVASAILKGESFVALCSVDNVEQLLQEGVDCVVEIVNGKDAIVNSVI